jgi:hypothetical protein
MRRAFACGASNHRARDHGRARITKTCKKAGSSRGVRPIFLQIGFRNATTLHQVTCRRDSGISKNKSQFTGDRSTSGSICLCLLLKVGIQHKGEFLCPTESSLPLQRQSSAPYRCWLCQPPHKHKLLPRRGIIVPPTLMYTTMGIGLVPMPRQ